MGAGAQVVELLPSKCKGPEFKLQYHTQKEKEREREKNRL
jgi:hypothetical protein